MEQNKNLTINAIREEITIKKVILQNSSIPC